MEISAPNNQNQNINPRTGLPSDITTEQIVDFAFGDGDPEIAQRIRAAAAVDKEVRAYLGIIHGISGLEESVLDDKEGGQT